MRREVNDLLILFVWFIICLVVVGKYAFNSGVYNGMNSLCEDDLVMDEEGEVYCMEIKQDFQGDYNFMELGDFNDDD